MNVSVQAIHDRVVRDLEHLSTISSAGAGVTRLAYSAEDGVARQWFREQCEEANLTVEVDRAGNIFGWSPGAKSARPLLLGSHLDSVIDAGRYDGIVGVVVGLEVARELIERDPNLPLGVAVFSCEESTRFGIGVIGSRLLMGELSYDDATNLTDRFGYRFNDVVEAAGLAENPIKVAEDGFISGFVEVHIDQGTLVANTSKIGIVETIAGVTRTAMKWRGEASHSGGRRRSERRDALLSAAEYLLELDKLWARLDARGFVQMTVGQLTVQPNSPNTVPGEVDAILDVRALRMADLTEATREATELASLLAGRRDIEFAYELLGTLHPVLMDPHLSGSLLRSATDLGIEAPTVPSFAGHDAMIIAKRFPTSMILIANPTGMSHSLDEAVDDTGLGQAISVLQKVALDLPLLD